MFTKLLIANRGEIACRIIKTARRMGIKTVAVYSTVDEHARHVCMADEALWIGAASPAESYLAINKIIDAAKASGAQAIHPGYGFLSENAAFAEACVQHGLVFIGPSAAAIRAMGSKSAAKRLMEKADVPLTPGYHGDEQAPDFLRQQANKIGYPVLIKAVAGGGGKGMRVVTAEAGFLDALASCQREASASFGDAQVLLEKYLQPARHIEVQIFGDSHGNYLYLYERDCSVQRRHQKVLEEAPAPGLTPERRAAMGKAAVNAARAVGYVGAGTVEFIVPGAASDGEFYFMEMNTRLQVEHPVTEMITGLDLVEWQLKVGAGETLPLAQEQITLRGHALEARIYAEDPGTGFLPSTGRVIHFAYPAETPFVRMDAGVAAGDEITPHYDPMIAKLIVWDDSDSAPRAHACARMLQALAEVEIVGVANNVDFLSRLVACPAFAEANLDTGLIEREQAFLFPAPAELPLEVWLSAALAELLRSRKEAAKSAEKSKDPYSPWHAQAGWRVTGQAQQALNLRCGDVEKTIVATASRRGFVFEIAAQPLSGQQFGGQRIEATGQLDDTGVLHADFGGRRCTVTVIPVAEKRHVFMHGTSHVMTLRDPLSDTGQQAIAEGSVMSPMPGKIIALLVTAGEKVAKGTPLLILEAMKMEHTVTAPTDGIVQDFHFAVGDPVAEGVVLMAFEENSVGI
ncbi:MAG: acetyl/propionyl/methylcrotonyl-CoA carboxylase subunit alpha [Rugosibacter sp.]|nr:acetyl/propionyl/methylcrotonyl-CoA carboxylase subunit alpha [Rugosibacter sp.]MDO9273755.1 acetyl/propionyl/methylcrotonyl-CoA carboxylase subunit alpha [Rugosibacter sp.]